MKKILLLTTISLFCFFQGKALIIENAGVPGANININMNGIPVENGGTTTAANTASTTTDTTSVNLIPNGNRCSTASLNASQFLDLKYKIEKQSSFNKKKFIESKIEKNCFSLAQVVQLVNLTPSYYQLDMAKLAYRHAMDTESYIQVADVLTISAERQQLLDFVSTAGSTSTTTTSASSSSSAAGTSTSTSSSTTVTTKNGGVEVETNVNETSTGGSTVEAAGCQTPQSEVESIKSPIKAESFGDDKMNVAKQALRDRCITVAQVKSIMTLFSFEDEKLTFAKYAYDYTHDTKNYYQVNSSFDFGSTKQELDEYVKTK